MATDREILKQVHLGHCQSAGLSDPRTTVGELHQEVFKFDLDADASLVERGLRVDKKCRVKSAYFTPTTALAAHATNYVTINVKKRDGAGGGATTVATTNTNSAGANVSLAAFVPAALTITASAAALSAGGVLSFESTETGTPATPLGCCTVVVEYE
jgi:hypothetical protein